MAKKRTPETLAEVFEQHLAKTRGARSLMCESKLEATQVAEELRKRGWRATVTRAYTGFMEGEVKVSDAVRVTGNKKV